MAKLSAHGGAVFKYTIVTKDGRYAAYAICRDGTLLTRGFWDRTWKLSGKRVKKGLTPEEVAQRRRELIAKSDPKKDDVIYLPGVAWPSEREIRDWLDRGIAETPDGYRVEPDGVSPNGWPAWTVILGII